MDNLGPCFVCIFEHRYIFQAGLQEPKDLRGKEVSFVIKKSLSGRIGRKTVVT